MIYSCFAIEGYRQVSTTCDSGWVAVVPGSASPTGDGTDLGSFQRSRIQLQTDKIVIHHDEI